MNEPLQCTSRSNPDPVDPLFLYCTILGYANRLSLFQDATSYISNSFAFQYLLVDIRTIQHLFSYHTVSLCLRYHLSCQSSPPIDAAELLAQSLERCHYIPSAGGGLKCCVAQVCLTRWQYVLHIPRSINSFCRLDISLFMILTW